MSKLEQLMIVVAIIAFVYILFSGEDAMMVCERTHSTATCMNTLR